MPHQYVRLALFQMFLVVLVIFFTGVALKTRLAPLPSSAFPFVVRNYGFLLLLLPTLWCLWAYWQSRRPTHDTRAEAVIAFSGVGLCLALIALGWLACSSAWSAPVIIQSTPAAPSHPQ